MGRMKGLGTGHLPSPSPWSGALPFSIELAQRLMVQPPHKSRALGAAHHSQSSANYVADVCPLASSHPPLQLQGSSVGAALGP